MRLIHQQIHLGMTVRDRRPGQDERAQVLRRREVVGREDVGHAAARSSDLNDADRPGWTVRIRTYSAY